MERGFQSLLIAGKYTVGNDKFSPPENSYEAYINRDMSFQQQCYEKYMLPSLCYPYASSYDTSDGNNRSKKIGESSKEDNKRKCIEREQKLKRLRNESLMESFMFSPTTFFSQLPELRSTEPLNQEEKRFKQCSSFSPISTPTNPQVLEPTMKNLQLITSYLKPAPLQQIRPIAPPPEKLSASEEARRKRNTLSEKTRSLQKVLPMDKKMDMATIYEETYKYIKYLKAQITVLESMPVVSSSHLGSENPRYGGLGKLNRQQLLEVVVNSPAAQTLLYSKGCCIYSLEQLILFKNIAEKNFFVSDPSIFS